MRGVARKIFRPIDSINQARVEKAFKDINDDILLERVMKGQRTLSSINSSLSLIKCTKLLNHNLADVREWAAKQIGLKMKLLKKKKKLDEKLEDQVYASIGSLLRSEEVHLKESALNAVKEIGNPKAMVQAAKKIVSSEDEMSLLLQAVELIKLSGNKNAEKIIKDNVYDKIAASLVSNDYDVRIKAVSALEAIDDPDYTVFCIRRQLKFENDISVINKIIDVLAAYKENKEAEDILRFMLKDSRFKVYHLDIQRVLHNEQLL